MSDWIIERPAPPVRPLIVEDAELLEARYQWTRAQGIPSPSGQFGWNEVVLGPNGEEPAAGDVIQVRLKWPQIPRQVARLAHVRFFVGTSRGTLGRLQQLDAEATFVSTSRNVVGSVTPLFDRYNGLSQPGETRASAMPYFAPGAGEIIILSRHYVPESPLGIEHDDTFREMGGSDTESIITLNVVGTAAADDTLYVGYHVAFLTWPANARRLGILRTPELFHG